MPEKYHEKIVDERLNRHAERDQKFYWKPRRIVGRPENGDRSEISAGHDAGAELQARKHLLVRKPAAALAMHCQEIEVTEIDAPRQDTTNLNPLRR